MAKRVDYERHEAAYRRIQERGQRSWDQEGDAERAARQAWVRAILSTHWPAQTPTALFLGCGAGEYAIDAASAGARVTGIDIAPTAIAMAKDGAARAQVTGTFIHGSVLALPLESSCFDLVIDDHCLHCIIGDDRQVFLAEARRVLRRGGLLLVRTMCSLPRVPPPFFAEQYDANTRCLLLGDVAIRYFGEPTAILEEITLAGFTISSHRIVADEEGSDTLEVEARS